MPTIQETLARITAPANEIENWAHVTEFDFWVEVGVLTSLDTRTFALAGQFASA